MTEAPDEDSNREDILVSIEIAADPMRVFAAFTADIDQWWRKGPKYRFVAPYRGRLAFEGAAGGRFVHLSEDGALLHVVGKILAWEPGSRLSFEWQGNNYQPGQTTHVEINFEPCEAGTRVTLSHRGFGALPAGHPARHGQSGRAFVLSTGSWWGEVLVDLKTHSHRKG